MDTEVLAERAILLARAAGEGARVLDLCAGSGCVGLAVAANVPGCRVVLADVSEAAPPAVQAECPPQRAQRPGDLRSGRRPGAARRGPVGFRRDRLQPALYPHRGHRGAGRERAGLRAPAPPWTAGADGLDFYRAIAARWGAALRPGGALLFEVGIGQAGDVGAILAQNQFEQIQTFQDTQGIGRVVEGVLNS